MESRLLGGNRRSRSTGSNIQKKICEVRKQQLGSIERLEIVYSGLSEFERVRLRPQAHLPLRKGGNWLFSKEPALGGKDWP